ncbi:MAG: hypothetical protein ACOCPX_08015 [Halapricum sp.]
MTDSYTTPVSTVFELQRRSLASSQQALEQSLAFQQRMSQAMIDSVESQASAQRRGVELTRTMFHSYFDAVKATVPGSDAAVEQLREAVDEQIDFLLENHQEVFETIETEVADGVDTYDELSVEYVDTLDEQIEMFAEAHEDLESQSVDAAEQMGDLFEDFREQTEEIQAQIQDVQQRATEAVDVEIED